jgi:mRNA-degrading endonuclease toxin of MazEF toxin-antitoxin module
MPSARRGEICLEDLGMVQKSRPVVVLSVISYQFNPIKSYQIS